MQIILYYTTHANQTKTKTFITWFTIFYCMDANIVLYCILELSEYCISKFKPTYKFYNYDNVYYSAYQNSSTEYIFLLLKKDFM